MQMWEILCEAQSITSLLEEIVKKPFLLWATDKIQDAPWVSNI